MLTYDEMQSLAKAKKNTQKYQYGSLYYKSAVKTYHTLKSKLADKYHCSVEDISLAEKGGIA